MPKVKSVSQLKKEADKWFSLYVRHRDSKNGLAECITCGVLKPIKQMQAGHFVSRRVNLLRYEEENVNAQCPGCNVFKYGEQYIYSKNLDMKYGSGKAEELMSKRNQTHKFTREELEEVISNSKEAIKFYERNL